MFGKEYKLWRILEPLAFLSLLGPNTVCIDYLSVWKKGPEVGMTPSVHGVLSTTNSSVCVSNSGVNIIVQE